MTISLKKEELIGIVGGSSLDSTDKILFQGVEYDSRLIQGGELFIALGGESEHGEKYLKQAFTRGAALALVESTKLLESFEEPERLIVVEDSLKAFWCLATWWREQLNIPIIAVTGSVGKTTVKELVASLLLRHAKGTYSLKSYNNHVGLPYSVLKITREHAWAMLEMGMSHAGEISNIVKIAKPTVAGITKIAPAHLLDLGSLEAIADAKFEVLDGLNQNATLILNGDDQVLLEAAKRHLRDNKFCVKYFGAGDDLDAQISNYKSLGVDGISFDLELTGDSVSVKMSVMGEHNAFNAACAALLVKSAFPNIKLDELAEGLGAFIAPHMRLNFKPLGEEQRIIDDCYNANPTSMRAALSVAADISKAGKKVGLVLGDMLELGEDAEAYHREIGVMAAELKPVFIIAVGDNAEFLVAEGQRQELPCFVAESPIAAAHTAKKMDFDILVVKASRGVALDKTVDTLLAMEG